MQVKIQLHILFRNWLFHNDGGCFKCLLSTRISCTYDNTENFLKAWIPFGVILWHQIRNKWIHQVIDQCFNSRRGLSKNVLVLWWQINSWSIQFHGSQGCLGPFYLKTKYEFRKVDNWKVVWERSQKVYKVWSMSFKWWTKNNTSVDFEFYIGFPDLWVTLSAENIDLAKKMKIRAQIKIGMIDWLFNNFYHLATN